MDMKKNWFNLALLFFSSCNQFSSFNQIETHNTLSEADIKYIQSLNLLDRDEKIRQFYSEFRKKNAGNFFTNKRIATYWIDEREEEKNELSFAFYSDIKSIDTVYNAGLTYCPYMRITKLDSTQFDVCVYGEREEIKYFFEEAMNLWKQHRSNK
jgi:hypothetical protein